MYMYTKAIHTKNLVNTLLNHTQQFNIQQLTLTKTRPAVQNQLSKAAVQNTISNIRCTKKFPFYIFPTKSNINTLFNDNNRIGL